MFSTQSWNEGEVSGVASWGGKNKKAHQPQQRKFLELRKISVNVSVKWTPR
jgi:hypothetical protein